MKGDPWQGTSSSWKSYTSVEETWRGKTSWEAGNEASKLADDLWHAYVPCSAAPAANTATRKIAKPCMLEGKMESNVHDDKLRVASALLEVVVSGGSRQVVAATSAALFRLVLNDRDSTECKEKLDAFEQIQSAVSEQLGEGIGIGDLSKTLKCLGASELATAVSSTHAARKIAARPTANVAERVRSVLSANEASAALEKARGNASAVPFVSGLLDSRMYGFTDNDGGLCCGFCSVWQPLPTCQNWQPLPKNVAIKAVEAPEVISQNECVEANARNAGKSKGDDKDKNEKELQGAQECLVEKEEELVKEDEVDLDCAALGENDKSTVENVRAMMEESSERMMEDLKEMFEKSKKEDLTWYEGLMSKTT